MRRRLNDAEITQLRAALTRDKLEIGWLRPWLWRRGWMLPAPLFWPVATDTALRWLLILGALFTFGLSMSYALFVAYLLAQSVWVLLNNIWKLKEARKIILRITVAAACIAGIHSLGPWVYPSLEVITTRFHNYGPLGVLLFLQRMFMHWNAHAERNLPSWHDYIDIVLATEAF